MSKRDKLTAWIRTRPAEGSLRDVRSLMEAYGWEPRKGGKHSNVFEKPGERPIVVPTQSGRTVGRYYLDAIRERLGLDEDEE